MIWESCYWKEPLLKNRKYILRFRCNKSTSERALAELEKRIFISFYSIRKLIEANKLSTINADSNWIVFSYKNVSKVDLLNWHKITEKYNLEKAQQEQKDLRWICNQIIHSYVFILDFDSSEKFSGFFISSDRERNNKLYRLERKNVLGILKLIGNDYPTNSKFNRSSKGDWVVDNC